MTRLVAAILWLAAASLSSNAYGQQPPPVPPGLPPQLAKDLEAEMARRQAAEYQMRRAQPDQQIEARELNSLNDEQMGAIVAELDRMAIDAARSGGSILPIGPRRDSMELAWYSGRLTRDGAYPKESVIPEGKAVQAYLVYDPATGPSESWPPTFLPGLSPQIENGTIRDTPLPMFFEMRVDAQADGTMEFAILASMGGQKVLVPGIKVKSEGFTKVSVPGGHTLAIHATLRDQTDMEKEQLERLRAVRTEGQRAFDDERVTLRTTLPPGVDPAHAVPPEVVERMRTTIHRESAIRALGADPAG